MADRRISGLIEAVTPNTTDVIPIVNDGITKKVTLNNFVKKSTFATAQINSLTPLTTPDPTTDQIVVQKTTGADPQKVLLGNIYPVVVNSSTINLNFTPSNRNLQASIIPGSINSTHFGTGVVLTSAIADGAITEVKIDPNAKIRGATGGGTDRIFYENDQIVNFSYTINPGKNAVSAGTITIQGSAVITVPDGSVWTIV